ncbi:TPA: S-adenosylhomocysteine hydrolase [Klebsiella oxytoca]|uniref:S-adenosylhomocysteine hydrolase n=1 Tax=Klebsiella oxytoca TaxID=571 RepID=UPI00190EDA06|nr:S-adenosylhomocysteine hydrolase [Klebsiella oxytoca]HCQ8324952.1 S-adenosylhomocysteine hydrolase [Klebsiella oxytoca]
MTIKARIQSRLKRSKCYVFTRDDFKDLAGYDQIRRALRELLKVGDVVYTKARKNTITGKLMPAAPGGSAAVVIEALERLNVDYRLVGTTSAYNSGKSNQIPASLEIKTSPRFKRMFSVGNGKLNG